MGDKELLNRARNDKSAKESELSHRESCQQGCPVSLYRVYEGSSETTAPTPFIITFLASPPYTYISAILQTEQVSMYTQSGMAVNA